jgi:hypothetical protein
MSAITKHTSGPSLATALPCNAHRISGLLAGMAINQYDACYIDATTGKVFASQDTGASAAQAQVHGYSAGKSLAGQAITLMHSVEVGYTAAAGLTPGAKVYLSASVAGGLDTGATNSHLPLGFAVNDQILLLRALVY